MSIKLRRDYLSAPLYQWAKGVMPALSETERDAIEAGDVWWDAELFTGDPDWKKLLDTPPARLSEEEQAFLDGPVDELCAMLDEWKIVWELGDLPPQAWEFMKSRRFFGMILPKQYGGLGFSNYGHAEVVKRLSTRSVTAAVTAMVPNSLGPGELMMRFGTQDQRDYWLPRLADGREIPAFGLTSPEAGSDAAAMIDHGLVCHGEWRGERVLGMRLNWHKRYITLGPVCTVLGLAFKLQDPDHLLGEREHLGITCALVPTDTPGVEIGRRHLPAMQMFQNGPNFGRDVFVPLDNVIGGPERVGQGWRMLMTALAAGRGISLPAQSGAATAMTALTTGAYARIRQQFGTPIGKFEGIQERLARLAGNAYVVDAARRLTCAGLDAGHHPSVISGLMKLHATETMRVSVTDSMDVHGGKTIIDGPSNYLGPTYRSVPVAITVEGANILTRSLMVFGQGAIRAHPYMLKEILALGDANRARGLDQFDKVFWEHVAHTMRTLLHATSRSWTGAAFAPSPDAGAARKHYRKLGRYAAAFALTSDMALLTLGGALKRRELLSARLGDILSEMYFLSAALKRWDDEGRQEADLPVLDYVMIAGSARIEASFDEVFANLPNRLAGSLLRFAILPLGPRVRGPSDQLIRTCADILLEPNPTRDRLVDNVYVGGGEGAIAKLLHAFQLTVETQPIHDRLRKAKIKSWKVGRERGLVTDEEAARLEAADKAVGEVIDVDDFSPEELTRHRAVEEAPTRTSPEEAGAQTRGSNPEPPASKKGAGASPARQPEPAE
ncbi:acyl-CoA dehydrogenase [Caulobacter sp. S45]|uniref:acyl-CoA dehydrogenase n=1 Tax=Caulobacter sp. S45 TaxID=1641861 RepID=UPI0015774E2B|nr:acyl-CoA dehydrogenase [Caulobacter sp. S45]